MDFGAKGRGQMTEQGPIYGVELIKSLPLLGGSMRQAMPNRRDLESVRAFNERTVAGYEVLLAHYRNAIGIIRENLHERKCFDCGNVAWHASKVAPYVNCKKCGSQDTRWVRKPME